MLAAAPMYLAFIPLTFVSSTFSLHAVAPTDRMQAPTSQSPMVPSKNSARLLSALFPASASHPYQAVERSLLFLPSTSSGPLGHRVLHLLLDKLWHERKVLITIIRGNMCPTWRVCLFV